MQERPYLSLRKVSIPSLDDKLKLVGHSGCGGDPVFLADGHVRVRTKIDGTPLEQGPDPTAIHRN